MKVAIVILSALFYAHVARGDKQLNGNDQSVQGSDAQKSLTCIQGSQTYQSGERFCKDSTTSSVCAYGLVYDFTCPPESTCLQAEGQKSVVCRKYVTYPPDAPLPEDANGEVHRPASEPKTRGSRSAAKDDKAAPKDDKAGNDKAQPGQQPQQSQTCSNGGQTYSSGDRFCKSATTSSVCAYGEIYDFECPSGASCYQPNPSDKNVVCRQYVTYPPDQPLPQDAQGEVHRPQQSNPEAPKVMNRRRRQAPKSAGKHDDKTGKDKSASHEQPGQNGQQPQQSQSCSQGGQTYSTGDRFCKDATTSSVCAYGQVYDFPCPSGASCYQPNPSDKNVVCRQYITYPPDQPLPADAQGEVHRPASEPKTRGSRSAAKDDKAGNDKAQAGQQPQQSKTCSNGGQTYSTGDRFCKSATTSSVCAYGEIYDFECPSGASCYQPNPSDKNVVCRQYVTYPPDQPLPEDAKGEVHQPQKGSQ